MSLSISAEDFWGCRLDEANKNYKWECPEEDEDEERHKLFISQATLGAGAKNSERNVIEVVVENEEGSKSYAIASLTVGVIETISLNIGFTSSVSFNLVSGNGPVDLVGNHLVGVDDAVEDEYENSESDLDESSSLVQDMKECINDHPSKKKKIVKKELAKEVDDSDEDSDEDEDSLEKSDDEDEEDNSEEDEVEEDENNEPKTKKVSKSIKKVQKGVMKSKVQKENKESQKNKKVSFTKDTKGKDNFSDIGSIKKALAHIKTLPKSQAKFENFLKSNLKVKDSKLIGEAWLWYQKNKLSN